MICVVETARYQDISQRNHDRKWTRVLILEISQMWKWSDLNNAVTADRCVR